VPPQVYEKFYRNWNPGMVGVQIGKESS
jgi:hypothetical protein